MERDLIRTRLPRWLRDRWNGGANGRGELLTGPVRGELLGPEHLAERAQALARQQRLAAAGSGPEAPLLTRLVATRRLLLAIHARLTDEAARDADVGPAGEWLLDNFHVVSEHIREVRESLPPDYYHQLPKLAAGPLAGYPRIYELATTLISHTEGRIDLDNVDLFVRAYQEGTHLSIGELWALPTMLRLGLIENVRRMALRTEKRLDELAAADAWAARIEAASEAGATALGTVLDDFTGSHPPLTSTFVARFLRQLHLTRGAYPPLVRLEQWIADEAMSGEAAATLATQHLALTQIMMAHSITSLRTLGHLDWRTVVERRSVLEAVLREDPSGYYPRMTFATRDRYRHVVEAIARRTGAAEADVAAQAVTLAREARAAAPADAVRHHVGYYLVDQGLPDLERVAGFRPRGTAAAHRWMQRHPDLVLFGGVVGGTGVALAAVLWLAGPEAQGAWLLVALLALVPASDIAVSVMNQLVTALLPPHALPKLDLRRAEGIPAELRTAVVIPTLLGSVEAVRGALTDLEVQFLANRGRHLHFALLSDFTDAPTEHREDDAAIVAAAVEGVRALNARHGGTREDLFYLLHRPRQWNPRQGVWMGWERKRGKLAEFNRFVRGSDRGFSTVVGHVERLRQIRYVITLDADTRLPPDGAALLIGAIAHPLNRAVYDPALGRVVRGYGILQPRVGVSLPSAHHSRFAAIHSGHPGIDPYTAAVSDVYQDLYGEGSFTGKGIYEVDAFEEATHGRFPENTLLSHDLIEGSYARAGLASEITVYDDYPARYLTFTARKHRWIRGDWQLLPWLRARVPGPDGPEPNRLSLLSRWKLLDNLRRSALEIGLLAFLVAGWTILPGSPVRWTLLGLAAIGAPWIVALLLGLLRPPLDRSWQAYYGSLARDALSSAQQLGLAVAFLPHQAWISADAILRTGWRLFVSRRFLLEWRTASSVEASISTGAGYAWRVMWPSVALSAGLFALVTGLAARGLTGAPAWLVAAAAGPLVLAWMAAPALADLLSRPVPVRGQGLTPAQREHFRRYAALHWAYFDHFVTADTHWLAPDNFQEDPTPVVAMRTSPTNIGLQLMATVSAHDLGLIPLADMTARLERTLATLDRLPRFRGHFYNWYDLRSLTVMEPAYVSTVDSGNLAGHLVAVRQACRQLGASAGGEDGAALSARLAALAERLDALAEAMDFRLLFDGTRELFAIGYRLATHALDNAHYDLLASEARLASYLAIARKHVPVEHWFHLGRMLTRVGGETALVSWSGSMFEYLMPLLVMESFPRTLLDQTILGSVERHVAYGRERGVPWGVSESAYNLRDRQQTYQYRAFGVPDLALKRGLGRDLVVAPYAAVLAGMVVPQRALANLRALERLGALGPYGFRDAIDFTRPDRPQPYAVVGNYMVHHVGMSLVALDNILTGDIWQRRFHADPLVRSAELLLHERLPSRLVIARAQATRADEALPVPEREQPAVRVITGAESRQPHVALLGRHPYTLMLTHTGGGLSRLDDVAVTRWRPDPTRDAWGQFCYVRDLGSGRVWSVAHEPVGAPADRSRTSLATDRVTFERADDGIETRTEIAVVPEDAAEVHSVCVTNTGDRPREVELTSYGEIVIAPAAADRAHPAFANLFVETEWHEWCTAITATRRPRSATERTLWCVHVVDAGAGRDGPVSCETDRARFLGRGRTVRDPAALEADGPLSGTTGPVLDPIFAIRARVRLAPGESRSVAFTTLVADTLPRALELADRYHHAHAAQRALDLAWTSQQVELRELDLSPSEATMFQELAGHLLYPRHAPAGLRVSDEARRRNQGSQPLLWANGISGDWPILLATIDAEDGLPTLRQLFAAHHYLRRRGMMVDLVVINAQPSGYRQELHERIMETMYASRDIDVVDRPGGVFVRRADQMRDDELVMLHGTARLHVPCRGRSLGRILQPVRPEGEEPAAWPEAPSPAAVAPVPAPAPAVAPGGANPPVPAPGVGGAVPLLLDNGFGGLTPEGDYEIRVRGDHLPPAPWANVVANPRAGFVVTERGGGFTWTENSYFYRLTPWHNDPASDPPGEVIYLQDDDNGGLWSATPAPVRRDIEYTVRHRPGQSVFRHEHAGLGIELILALAGDDPIKVSTLRVTNRTTEPRRLRMTAYAEWVLGVHRDQPQQAVQTSVDLALGAAFARNTFEAAFANRVAYLALGEPVSGHTTDRLEFLGRNGTLADPAGLRQPSLAGVTGAGLDPCAALQCTIPLAPGETRVVTVLLGSAPNLPAARTAIARFRQPARLQEAVAAGLRGWEARLGAVTVQTPEPTFDAMLNRWALYQAMSCRIWGRSAIYQSSGAYGFRDQLQDVLACVHAAPEVAREHILRAAARQFVEGDVQHWWHPHSGRGVRTRFSDDLAWLPYAVVHYAESTGDDSIWDEAVPFLEMRTLAPDEHEIYDLPSVTNEQASVYEHCRRALARASTAGAHGLPLIGIGDWNDGLSRVGVEGRGESVWLAWFLVATLEGFARHAERRGDGPVAATCRAQARAYASAVEAHGWDGAWYRRAYFDDGTPLGSAENDECRIDSLAQSWSVISGAGAPDRAARAMASLEEHLVREDARLIMLLAPPFDHTPRDPGYIKGYLPGVRENGAQYTHAALWAVLATAMQGRGDRAFALYQLLNPLTHARTPAEVATYKVEPYVVAADVYVAPGQLGRGGWTWYTGAASWLYRVGLEAILGFTRRGDTLRLAPRVPADWPEFAISYRHGTARYRITVRRPAALATAGAEVVLDGRVLDGDAIPLVSDGADHAVEVRPKPSAPA